MIIPAKELIYRDHCRTAAISPGITLPRVQPIIPTWRKEPFDDPGWLFEFKYDGFRAVCYLEQGRGRFISRNGNILPRLGALCERVADEFGVDAAILDGEVIAADETGRPQFLRPPPWHAGSVVTRAGAEVHRTIGFEAMLEVERRTVER